MHLTTQLGLTNMARTSAEPLSSVHPANFLTGEHGPDSGTDDSAQAPRKLARSPAPQTQSEIAAQRMLLTAVKVAHEELGEKISAFLGCAAALWLGGLSRQSLCNTLVLVLLEAVSDVAKAAVYAASKIDATKITLAFHGPTLLGVVLVGGGAWCAVLAALRINCLFNVS
jgi:hypothetical protein